MASEADVMGGNRWALVLAGGDGTRLQELTRQISGAPIPKQYCRILGKRTMLQTTIRRVGRWAPRQRLVVVLNRNHLALARQQLHGVAAENMLVQPCNRDTGPGILFALLRLAQRDPQAIVAAFPSDHYVGNDATFMHCVERAGDLVATTPDQIVLLGIRPDRVETSLGYILPGGPAADLVIGKPSAFHVGAFFEKPSAELATRLVAQGGLWNCFVMVFRVARMLELLRRRLPVEYAGMLAAVHDSNDHAQLYERLRSWNFSSQFLTLIPEHLSVLCVEDVRWDDWGTPEAIYRTLSLLNPPQFIARWRH